ncbi:MAG: hypothetical protein A2231_05820 [Candidatus Firestonebacteria bacterium RIFOXYA2_FULL_40_8]|nr:MAG: hypothetical protein A2231_05820 [Candidatus Firestonebacteria bacterium RIFOXYA2_FULL_40_8]
MAKINLKNISFDFKKDNPILDNVNLEIKDGKTLCILGPSGCGKTTLLKVIAGLIAPQKGEIYFNGKLFNEMSPKDRNIGMVFQGYALYPQMKAKKNLTFWALIRKIPAEQIDEKVKTTSEIMGIGFDKLLGRFPHTLSGGEKQRVALARCIIRTPSVFLLDEPLSNLDAKLRRQTKLEIKSLFTRLKITAVYVTHDQSEAITLGDEIAVMDKGKIVQMGSYSDLYSNPVSTMVASFFGRINLFPKGNLLQGVRPENTPISPKETPGFLPAKIDVIESIFPEKGELISCKVGMETYFAKVETEKQFTLGQQVYIGFEKDKVLHFETETGRRARL